MAFKQGGWFMYLILALAMVALAIIIERLIVIMFKNRIDSVGFINQVVDYVQSDNIDGALRFCDRSNAALPQIVRSGLENFDENNEKEIQNAIELKAMSVIPRLEKRTSYLSMIANVATLTGLLGTIWGLITSFQAVAHADASQKAALLSGGIAMALNTTAFGLIVAIPCMMTFAFLHERTNDLIDDINENVSRLFQFIERKMKTKNTSYEHQESNWQK
jgi:biopolymer transport protein ExbB